MSSKTQRSPIFLRKSKGKKKDPASAPVFIHKQMTLKLTSWISLNQPDKTHSMHQWLTKWTACVQLWLTSVHSQHEPLLEQSKSNSKVTTEQVEIKELNKHIHCKTVLLSNARMHPKVPIVGDRDSTTTTYCQICLHKLYNTMLAAVFFVFFASDPTESKCSSTQHASLP